MATIPSGFAGVMELQFDRNLNELWAVCDNTCNGRHNLMRVNPSTGVFAVVATFERPTGMPNYNNEGFAMGGAGECVADRKPVFWANDAEDLGVAIRSGNMPCTALFVGPDPVIPEFPIVPLSTGISAALLVAVGVFRRRQLVL